MKVPAKTRTTFKTSNITYLPLHNGQKLKNTENKILPGSFTQFQPQSHVETVGIEPLNPFGVQQTTCSKPSTDSIPIAPSISTFPPQALPSAERKPEQQFPHSHQNSSVLHPISIESSKNLHLKSNLYHGPQTQLHIGRVQQVNTLSSYHLLRFKPLMATH